MPPTWEYTLYIPHDPRAVAISRRTLTDILTTHHLPTLVEPAQLLASELLGNAIRHTKGPAALKLRQSGPSFRLGAWDTDPTPPTQAPADDEAGRGLQLIHAYADDWGWFQVNGAQGGEGKYVWCELDAKPR
ncbi:MULTISPECIES: ATP-binding protein [unclassified Streptomyces]|uniref:ATP-binding protein n=1 Tax=unclassified Streptomyces TaxID=2593676 RepID=UPI002366870F|nr:MULTISPECIES: ATP-binding protein [unclassified Streptomyces]MDF3142952.1 ATP-binding protein [Streptomyces sp. T21Q-yed]WDF40006.1 ATP-binding protein [Streptomyces sp. T12]